MIREVKLALLLDRIDFFLLDLFFECVCPCLLSKESTSHLDAVLKEREELEQTCAELKQQMAQVINLMKGISLNSDTWIKQAQIVNLASKSLPMFNYYSPILQLN